MGHWLDVLLAGLRDRHRLLLPLTPSTAGSGRRAQRAAACNEPVAIGRRCPGELFDVICHLGRTMIPAIGLQPQLPCDWMARPLAAAVGRAAAGRRIRLRRRGRAKRRRWRASPTRRRRRPRAAPGQRSATTTTATSASGPSVRAGAIAAACSSCSSSRSVAATPGRCGCSNCKDGQVRALDVPADDFEVGRVASGVQPLPGAAGWRLSYPLNRAAAARRADRLSRRQLLPRHRRAAGLRPVGARRGGGHRRRQGEEFPAFTTFWFERPAPGSARDALLCPARRPARGGAYRFVVRPGTDTVLDVQARLYLRAPVATLGIAPLTSMFLAGENQPVARRLPA